MKNVSTYIPPIEECKMTEPEILEGVLEVLSNPERWNKGEYARTSDGTLTLGYDPRAVTYCLVGAIQKVTGGCLYDFSSLVDRLADLSNTPDVTDYNDDPKTTHEDIVLLLKNAIYQASEDSILNKEGT